MNTSATTIEHNHLSQEMKHHHHHHFYSEGHPPSHHRYDHEERKLFIGGLSWDTTKDDICDFFSKFGPVESVWIKYNVHTGKPRGFGFLSMETEESVEKILASGPHELKGKVIEPKRVKLRPICKKIFVGGVDPRMEELDIKKYFSKYGPVEGIELPFDHQRSKRREFCFVIFETEQAADAACRQSKQIVGGKECDIKKAQPQPIAQEQKRLAQVQNSAQHPQQLQQPLPPMPQQQQPSPHSMDYHRKKTPKARPPQANSSEPPSAVLPNVYSYNNGYIPPNMVANYNPHAQPINGFYGHQPAPGYFNYPQPPFDVYQFQNYAAHPQASYEFFYAQQIAFQQASAQANGPTSPHQMMQIAAATANAAANATGASPPNPAAAAGTGPVTYTPGFTIVPQQQQPQPPQPQAPIHQQAPPPPGHLPMPGHHVAHQLHSQQALSHHHQPHHLSHHQTGGPLSDQISYQNDGHAHPATLEEQQSLINEMSGGTQSPNSINGNLNNKMILSNRKQIPMQNYHYKTNVAQQ